VWWRAALILAAGAAALAPLPPTWIERWYSSGLYPRIQAFVTSTSNLVPFALFDALIAVTVVAWMWAVASDLRQARRARISVIRRLLLRTVVCMAGLYLAFLLLWGLNYRRTKLADKLQFDQQAISAESVLRVATAATGRLNALYLHAHELGWPAFGEVGPSLPVAFTEAQRELGIRSGAVVGRPKATWLAPYFRRAGVSGMTDPYFLETLVESELLPFERPFVVAHEWAHLAGFADESEASFVGWLTCLRGTDRDQYSGWLFLYGELAQAIDDRDRRRLRAALAPGPRADLEAIARRLRRQISPAVSRAGWQVYDRYLKANRVEAGAASYAEVVRLVLGVRFGPEWTPLLATRAE
jgi:hypothetical protein